MKKWQKITVVACSGCFLLAVCAGIAGFVAFRHLSNAFWAGFEDFSESEQPWVECTVPHPGGTPTLTFMQKSIHPFLAEYEYKLRFGTGGDAIEQWLPLNTGGRTHMNAYWYPADTTLGPTIRLQDHWGEYLVRLHEQKTYLLVRYKGRVFAGEITESTPGCSMGQVYPVDGEPEIQVTVGDSLAHDITESSVAQQSGEYFGRIDGKGYPLRFVPSSEAPEAEIEMVKW